MVAGLPVQKTLLLLKGLDRSKMDKLGDQRKMITPVKNTLRTVLNRSLGWRKASMTMMLSCVRSWSFACAGAQRPTEVACRARTRTWRFAMR